MTIQSVLIDGQWKPSAGRQVFQAVNPSTMQPLPEQYPVSPWSEVEAAIEAASRAADAVRGWSGSRFADFLDDYANRIEQHADGVKLASHHSVGAIGYTGARSAGVVLKTAADKVGKPIYLELSSINPVFFLPGALAERTAALAEQFSTSCLMAVGQFCTNPGLVVTIEGPHTEDFIQKITERFVAAPVGTLLSEGTLGGGTGYSVANTLMRVSGKQFLSAPEAFQTEAFGNSSLIVVAADESELLAVSKCLEGNLTGSIYSATDGADDSLYNRIAAILRQKVGRLLNDKMPTGVAVVPSMNHGGPFPATGHPGFTAVGIPSSIRRFAMLQCYDGVRPQRLPPALQNKNPTGSLWRRIDGTWTQSDVTVTPS